MQPIGKAVRVTADSIEDQTATITNEDGSTHAYNLATLFDFRNDLETALSTHAAVQQFWETLAVDLSFRAREFEEVGYAKWWAHSRRYARYASWGGAGKDTVDGVKDLVIAMFSRDTTAEEIEYYAQFAWTGWLQEIYGTKDKAIRARASGAAPGLAQFRTGMLQYHTSGWTYEQVMLVLRDFEEAAKKASTIARTLNDRSFKMREFTELERAKFGNIGPMSVDALVQRVSSIIFDRMPKRGGTIPDDLSIMREVSVKTGHSPMKEG